MMQKLLVGATVFCLLTVSARIASSEQSSPTALRHETRLLLRQHATAENESQKTYAAASLCDWYVVLRSDPRFDESEMIKGDAVKVRHRLLTIARQTENRLKRQGIDKPSNLSEDVDSILEQDINATSATGTALPEVAGGGALADPGWQLVELIQRIVVPDFWESRGGPGSIRYFAMQRVLVVRATSDVHQQLKDLLTALR